jgi:hypothetical protein
LQQKLLTSMTFGLALAILALSRGPITQTNARAVGPQIDGTGAGVACVTPDGEQWSSNWGPVVLQYGLSDGITIPVLSGTFQQAPGELGCYTSGSYTVSTGVMVLNYFQPWNNALGKVVLQMNSQGTQLEGPLSQTNDFTGVWTMTRPSPSILAQPQR